MTNLLTDFTTLPPVSPSPLKERGSIIRKRAGALLGFLLGGKGGENEMGI
jgi:hypothetical protein